MYMVTVKPITPELLPVILSWWEERELGAMPPEVLPPLGAVAIDGEGHPLAAAWLYEPLGCRAGFLDWLVSRPGLPQRLARSACRMVFANLEMEAASRGMAIIFASVFNAAMLRESLAGGYEIAATGCIHLTKTL